jgi:lipoyl(octanoyl) transferase
VRGLFIDYGLSKYPIALLDMKVAHESVLAGGEECIFITEHEAMYSAGKSSVPTDFLESHCYKTYYPRRGGRVTVHSEGQLVIYPIINLRKRAMNVSCYVRMLENWMIDALSLLNIEANLSEEGIGVWVDRSKVGFVGINVERGVASHGFCLNISNDLSLFNAIIPCGISKLSVTSVSEILGRDIQIPDIVPLFTETTPFIQPQTNLSWINRHPLKNNFIR